MTRTALRQETEISSKKYFQETIGSLRKRYGADFAKGYGQWKISDVIRKQPSLMTVILHNEKKWFEELWSVRTCFQVIRRKLKRKNRMVPSSLDLKDPECWRKRAKEVHSSAEEMHDARTKSLMVEIAENYQQIAKSCEKITNLEKR